MKIPYLLRLLIALLALTFFSKLVFAQEKSILGATLFQEGIKPLSQSETRDIIKQDGEVEMYNATGENVRRWKNDASGKFIASRNRIVGGGRGDSGSGEWKLTENGQYCVQIEWRLARGGVDNENWCRVLYLYKDVLYLAPTDLSKAGDRRYGAISFK